MSSAYYGRQEGSTPSMGSVRRPGDMAQAGYNQGPYYTQNMDDVPSGDLGAPPRRPMGASNAGQSRLPRAQGSGKDSNIGQNISKPTQAPQWPLAGPIGSPLSPQEGDVYRPPPDRPQQAPPRPQRPSVVPSMLDQSRLQEPTPIFRTAQSDVEDYDAPSPQYGSLGPITPSPRLTTSSMGSIPDFPVPTQTPTTPGHLRKSTTLGPPPSARRGASSFYSHASFVSPIPEESLASRSHASYASSAAMPESWRAITPAASPSYYDDTDTERDGDSINYEATDESQLVRSASIGKRGKPALVDARSSLSADAQLRPSPLSSRGLEEGPSYVSTASSNSTSRLQASASPSFRSQENPKDRLTPDAILGAYAVAGSTDVTEPRLTTPSPRPFNRLSAIRRPPKLDIDAVRDMEARGSMTSLPDLIRRATRLAGMIDRGKRPASRFEDLSDYLDEKSSPPSRDRILSDDRYRSGLSDMLAAFPPPGQPQGERQSRGSWFKTMSWPLAPGQQNTDPNGDARVMNQGNKQAGKRRRRCCGLPLWAFLLVLFLLLCVVAAAIVIPLEFFVFKNFGNQAQPRSAMAQCQETLTCQNAGTNVVTRGVCSCICTNGFTGSDCSAQGSEGCTTTNLVSSDGNTNINNVTLGRAIPRLIANANSNFSIPLSGTSILAKLNTGNLSCIPQNSLVTFDGRATRMDAGSAQISGGLAASVGGGTLATAAPVNNAFVSFSVITVDPEVDTTITVELGNAPGNTISTRATTSVDPETTPPTAATTTTREPKPSSVVETTTRVTRTTPVRAEPSDAFTVTEEVLDFARIVVLFVLQEEDSGRAEEAQGSLQRFFAETKASERTRSKASNLAIGGDNIANLISFTVNVGSGAVGGGPRNNKRDVNPPSHQAKRRRGLRMARDDGSELSQ